MKAEGEGIREILSSGRTPTVYSFRVPQPFSSWKNGKATARQMQARKHKPGQQAFSINTDHSKDMKAVDRHSLNPR